MNQKAQIAPFAILVVVVLILAIAAVMLVGEVGFQRIRLANITDSALVSAASKFCQGLNQIRILHTRMLLNYIQMQATLLFSSPYPSKALGYRDAYLMNLYGIQSNYDLFNQANNTAEDMAKDLRVSLYETAFGGALVDEPKPFLESEVTRDANSRVIGLDYDRYTQRDSHFTSTYRSFKSGNRTNWYRNNLLSYSFNKSKDRVLAGPGSLSAGEPASGYESHLRVEMGDVPEDISVRAQRMVAVFFYCAPHKGCWVPGFVIHPWAWINRIDIGSDSFGLNVQKHLTFSRLPFFPREVDLNQRSRVRIRGSVWSGYEFRLEQ